MTMENLLTLLERLFPGKTRTDFDIRVRQNNHLQMFSILHRVQG